MPRATAPSLQAALFQRAEQRGPEAAVACPHPAERVEGPSSMQHRSREAAPALEEEAARVAPVAAPAEAARADLPEVAPVELPAAPSSTRARRRATRAARAK